MQKGAVAPVKVPTAPPPTEDTGKTRLLQHSRTDRKIQGGTRK